MRIILILGALLIGNLLTLVYALFTRKSGERFRFVRRRGFEVSMGVLISVPCALFLSLFIWAALYFPLRFIFGVEFSASGRMNMLAVVYPFAYAYILTRWIREEGLLL